MEDFNLKDKLEKIKKNEPKRNILKNSLKAFLVGGIICALCEIIFMLYHMKFVKDVSNSYTILTIIFIAAILTSFGIYDRIGQFAGCGSIVPITGFANSMTSSAIESHSEGLVLGVLNNIFKLAGSVISVSIICGVISGLIRYFGGVIFG